MDARFKALSNETRREILLLLAEGPMAAGRLQERFPITFAPLSYHLSVLKHSGLVTAKKEGQYRLYDLNREALEGMVLWLSGLVECQRGVIYGKRAKKVEYISRHAVILLRPDQRSERRTSCQIRIISLFKAYARTI